MGLGLTLRYEKSIIRQVLPLFELKLSSLPRRWHAPTNGKHGSTACQLMDPFCARGPRFFQGASDTNLLAASAVPVGRSLLPVSVDNACINSCAMSRQMLPEQAPCLGCPKCALLALLQLSYNYMANVLHISFGGLSSFSSFLSSSSSLLSLSCRYKVTIV